MPNLLPQMAARIFNTPLMIQGHKLDTVLAALGPRLFSGEDVPDGAEIASKRQERSSALPGGGYMAGEGIAVLPAIGTLVRRGSWLDAASGVTSYAGLQRAASDILMDDKVRGLMLEIDSYGGEAGGCFDLVNHIRSTASALGKPVWAHANEAACSGGYAIACAADRIWLPQMGQVGSVGVVTAHVDMSKADEKAGLKWTYIHAGDHKVDGNPHAPLPAGVKADLQSDINAIMAMFVGVVAKSRRMSPEAVRATQAGVYRGQAAVEVGLADSVGTIDEALSAFAKHLGGASVGARQAVAPAFVAGPQVSAGPMVPALPGVTTDELIQRVVSTSPDILAERDRRAAMVKLAPLASKWGVNFDVAAAIAAGISVDEARMQIMNQAAEDDDTSETIVTSTSHTAREANTNAAIKAGWDRAVERRHQERGLAK